MVTFLFHHICHVLLSHCQFLDVAGFVRLDNVDAGVVDAGLDGLARLNGEAVDGDARQVDDAHIGRIVE